LRDNERYQELADYVTSRYEAGEDTSDRRGISRRRRQLPPIRIRDPATDAFLMGAPRGGGQALGRNQEWQSWEFVSGSGAVYEVAMNVTQLERSPPPEIERNHLILGVLITAIFSWLITLGIIRPIKMLQAHVEGLGSGDLDRKLESSILRRKDEIGDLAVEVDQMSARIRDLIESKQRLFYDVSHELRAPLARLSVANEIASMRAEKAGEPLDTFERFDREITALSQLITELMEYAKNDKSASPEADVSVSEITTQVIDDMGFSERESRLTLTLNVPENDICRMRPALLVRALKNIIENALKYSPPQSNIDVQLVVEQSQYVIKVKDAGGGIPEEQLSTVIQPFTRLHGEGVEGVGLGLSIVHRAMQDMGGSLTLSNHDEGGLLACLSFPV